MDWRGDENRHVFRIMPFGNHDIWSSFRINRAVKIMYRNVLAIESTMKEELRLQWIFKWKELHAETERLQQLYGVDILCSATDYGNFFASLKDTIKLLQTLQVKEHWCDVMLDRTSCSIMSETMLTTRFRIHSSKRR